ncbi:MAG TPA: SRPBCC family protein [Actinomycetes bacterium]
MSETTEIHREVGQRRIAAGEARSAVLRRRYDAPIEDVWDACTNPRRIDRWLLPVSGDLRAGGSFSLQGNASGEILRCEPPRLLTVTWVYGDRPADEVELRLTPGNGGDTELELEHASVCDTAPDGVTDAILGVGVGWELPLTWSLPAYLRGEFPDAPAVEWYQPTPEHEQLAERLVAVWAELVHAAGAPSPNGSGS